MTKPMSIELSRIISNFRYAHAEIEDENIIAAIKALIKSKLPEKKRELLTISHSPRLAYPMDNLEAIGYNTCLADITKIIEGI